jgi:hypothetical protein
MDDVITRIVEIEKQCSADVGQARIDYGKNIEAHKRVLEEKGSSERARIISTQNSRLIEAVEVAKKETKAASDAILKDTEHRLQNPELNEAIKKDIISILLAG